MPFSEGRLTLLGETCTPLPRNGYPSSEGGVPTFRRPVVPRVGRTGTPFPTDELPLSEGGGANFRRKGAIKRVP